MRALHTGNWASKRGRQGSSSHCRANLAREGHFATKTQKSNPREKGRKKVRRQAGRQGRAGQGRAGEGRQAPRQTGITPFRTFSRQLPLFAPFRGNVYPFSHLFVANRASCPRRQVAPDDKLLPTTSRPEAGRHYPCSHRFAALPISHRFAANRASRPWSLMSGHLGTLALRSVHPASPVLLTKNGPL